MTHTTPEAFDARRLQGPKDSPWFAGALPTLRQHLTRAAIELLAEQPNADHGDVVRLAYDLYERVRDQKFNDVHTVGQALSVPELANPIPPLQELFRILLRAGTLRATLVAHRAEIDRVLAVLDQAQARS